MPMVKLPSSSHLSSDRIGNLSIATDTLAHRGPSRHDDQIRRLKSRGHLIQFVVSGGHSGHNPLSLMRLLDDLEGIAEYRS